MEKLRDLADSDEVAKRMEAMAPFHAMLKKEEFKEAIADLSKVVEYHANTIVCIGGRTNGDFLFLMMVVAGSFAANNIAMMTKEPGMENVDIIEDIFKDFIFFTYHQLRGILQLTDGKSEEEIEDMMQQNVSKGAKYDA